MFDIFRQNPIKGDPSKFSFREEMLDLKPKMDGTYIDKKTGEKFHLLKDPGIKRQRFLSMMLKGVINVSDVVKIGNSFYSHEQNFNKLESLPENVRAELAVDNFLLSFIFRDTDHKFYPNSSRGFGKNVVEHHNMRVDERNQKVNFFDFNSNWLGELLAQARYRDEGKTPSSINANSVLDCFKNRYDTEKVKLIINILKRKTEQLTELFSEDKFSVFQKIIKRSGVYFDEGEDKNFFLFLCKEIESLRGALTDIK